MKTTKLSGYLPGIDSLRAIAVTAVILFHINFLSIFKGGFTGVDIFFVISGYVISRSIFNRKATDIKNYLSEFYKRRILRILPALVICLTISVLLSVLFIPDAWLSSTIDQTGLSSFWGYSNFSLIWNNNRYFSPGVDYNPFLHTWSLAVEEQFYLLFPLIFFIWLKFKESKSVSGIISKYLLAFIGILSFIYVIFETSSENTFYLLPGRFWELSSGALLFQLHTKEKLITGSKINTNLLLSAGFILAGIGFVYADQQAFPFPWAIAPVLSALLIIIGAVSSNEHPAFIQRFINLKPIAFIGKISYSLYLWHWPVAVLMRWTTGIDDYRLKLLYLIITFILAVLSFYFIENPVRKNKVLIKLKNWKIISGGIALITLMFSLSLVLINEKNNISLSVTSDNYVWRSWYHSEDRPEEPVTPNPEIKGHKIFVIGDSHTAAYRTMLNIVSSHLGIEVYEYEEGGCAVAGFMEPMSALCDCTEFFNNSLKEIKETAEPGDIVFLASLRMPELVGENIDSLIEIMKSEEAARNRNLSYDEADQLISEFEALDLYVIIDAPKPVLKASPYRCSDWFNRMNPVCSEGLTVSRSKLLELRQPAMELLNRLQEAHGSLYVWDPLLMLCTDEECSAYDQNGLPLFFDDNHLSGNGNRILAPSFMEMVSAIWKRSN